MIIFAFISCLCASIFTAIGICAHRMTKPMWFWSGSSIKPEEISDIPAYNRANGIMWCTYSLFFWLSALLALFDLPAIATATLFIGSIGGGIALIPVYQHIYKKYAKK